jgi:type I restriction enzyme S subunit
MAFEIEYKDTWLTPSLEDVVMFVIGGDWGKEPTILDEDYVEVLCIRGSEIRDWSKNKGNTASIRAIKKSSLETRQLIEGDILLEISGGGPDQPVGRTVLIDKQTLSYLPEKPKVCTNFLRLLRFPKAVESSFINMFFGFFYASGEIVNYQGGSNNLRNLKFAEFSKIKIPLPPLNEQHRIVSKIEELFSELDNGVSNLKLAQNQLKVYRQALLKHAFEGKLTEQWRKENNPEPAEKLLERIKEERQNRYEQELKDWKAAVKAWEKDGNKGRKPGKPKAFKPLLELTKDEIESLPKIPNSWLWQKNENYLFEVKDGTHDTPKYQEQGIPFITQKNIKNNKIDFSNVQYISEEDHTKFYKRSNVEQGDLIISMIGAGRGECCIVNTNRIFSIKNVGLFKFFNELQSNLFYLYFFKSTSGLNLVLKNSKGGAQPFIGLTELRNWPLPVCSLEEQAEVANLLESQFSVIENLEQTIESGLQKSEALRQSILKKAFEGKLVPQDPNDEPATELLKRIQAEKKKYMEEQKQQKKRKPKNTKKMSKELSIEEVLKTSDKPMLAKDVWQKSKHKENIEDFYKELKDIQSKIKEVKKGTESLLSLAK